MTVKDIAQEYISQIKSKYTPVTEQDFADINDTNYEALKIRCDKLKEDLDSIIVRKDYTKVDGIYKAVYAQQLMDAKSVIVGNLREIQKQANHKFEILNQPIRDKYKDVLDHYQYLSNIHKRLHKFKDIFLLYNKIFKCTLTPISDLDINLIVEKTNSTERLISMLNTVNTITNLDPVILNTIVIGSIALLIFNITGILVSFIVFTALVILVVLFLSLKNNQDLISFTLQDVEEPNKELYREIDWSDKEFEEFGLRMQAENDKFNSEEILELEAKSQGKGVEVYRQEYDKYIDDLRKELENQYTLQAKMEEKINEFIDSKRASMVPLGEKFSWSYVLDYNFSLGMKDNAIEETKVNVKNNVILVCTSDRNKKEELLLLLALNLMSNVRCTNCDFMYYDRINRGDALVSFNFISQIMKIYTVLGDIVKDVDDLMTNTTRKVKKITRDIDTYNKGADNEVNLPTPYTMAIFEITDLGDGKTELEDKNFTDKIPGMLSSGIIPVLVIQDAKWYKLQYDSILIRG